jgi:hypothetical protein
MENNLNIKKWNKESFYSIGALTLAYLSIEPLSNMLYRLADSAFVFRLEQFIMFKIGGGHRLFSFLDVAYLAPIILSVLFLAIALFMGIKSIRKISGGAERGRMIGIISTTITGFVWLLIIIFNVFPL